MLQTLIKFTKSRWGSMRCHPRKLVSFPHQILATSRSFRTRLVVRSMIVRTIWETMTRTYRNLAVMSCQIVWQIQWVAKTISLIRMVASNKLTRNLSMVRSIRHRKLLDRNLRSELQDDMIHLWLKDSTRWLQKTEFYINFNLKSKW